jgi:histidinol dehydrogenase
MSRRLDARAPDFEGFFAGYLSAHRGQEQDVATAVRAIIQDVRTRGDAALFALTERFDQHRLDRDTVRVSAKEIDAAEQQCSTAALSALTTAVARIESYHRRQLPRDEWFDDDTGAKLGWRWTPLDSVGIYVPGGTASYPSSVLMNAIPARVAGVRRVAMVSPASKGTINPLVLAAARQAGVNEVYRVGGAQAVAALAFGTESIKPVDKIVGPGNAYVAEAKREVFGRVGIDSIAGPSEILIIADDSGNPEWIAADLLSQAEHDESSQCVLITSSEVLADRVAAEVTRSIALLPRRKIAEASWRDHGAIILVAAIEEACDLADRMAPEHLEIVTAHPERLLANIRHAGAIFLGPSTPEAMGDYIAGPNHVLPTSRTARFSSGLSVLDFMKRTTLLQCSPETLSAIGADAIALAEAEGLDAHARAIAARLNRRRRDQV